MQIDFPNLCLPKVTAMGTVSFQSRIDGEFVWCEISFDALCRHFGAKSTTEKDLLNAFHRGKTRIEGVAMRHLEAQGGRAIMLMANDF